MDAYKAQTDRATGDYSFLTGVADDVDECIHNHSDFQDAIRTQVQVEYARQQHLRLRTHLDGEGNTFVNATIEMYNQSIPTLNADIKAQVDAKWIKDSNDTFTTWLMSEGTPSYNTFVEGVAISSIAPDLAALNSNIKAQVEGEWVKLANAALETHLDNEGYSYVTGVNVTSVSEDITALNNAIETQVQAEWVRLTDISLNGWLSSNGYGYVTGAAVTSVSQDMTALNSGIETQVEAKWVSDADATFNTWLQTHGYDSAVTGVSITSVTPDIAALNTNVDNQVTLSNINNNQDRLNNWLQTEGYTYVTGATITEVNPDLGPVNNNIRGQVEARWISDSDANLQAWLTTHNYNSFVTGVSITTTSPDIAALNTNIEGQVEANWVSNADAALQAHLAGKGYTYVTDQSITTTSPDISAINTATESQVQARWVADADANLQTWITNEGYSGIVTGASITTHNLNYATLNANIENQVEANWIASADADLQSWLSSEGHSGVTASISTTNPDMTALNNNIENQVEANWIIAADAALQAYLSSRSFGFVTGQSITTTSPDMTAINTAIEGQVRTQYIADQNTALTNWKLSNSVNYVTGVIDTSNYQDVTALNTDMESQVRAVWRNGRDADLTDYVTDNPTQSGTWSPTPDIDDAISDLAAFNSAVKDQARQDFLDTTGLAAAGVTLATFNGGVGFNYTLYFSTWSGNEYEDPPDFELTPATHTYNAFALTTPWATYYEPHTQVAYPGYTAYTPGVSAYPGYTNYPGYTPAYTFEAFSYAAYPTYVDYALASYPGYTDFTLAVTPAFVPFAITAYPGYTDFTPSPAYGYNSWNPTAFAGYTDFTLAPYPTYVPFSFDPVYNHTEYVMLRNHKHVPYYLRMPNDDSWRRYDVKWMKLPDHIDKHDMNHLFYYHKAWYYQEYDTCEPTCTGSMSPKTDRDNDELAPDRTCDSDDIICPTTNNDPTWEEFNLILDARKRANGKHPSCPVSNPCIVSPPPCYYTTTECVPEVVLSTTLDNSARREWEDENQNEDEKYLHEPFPITDVVTWKLVSGRVSRDSPWHWNYNDGLVMNDYTSPVDGKDYKKVCTFALVQKDYKWFDRGISYGYAIAESDPKDSEGHTQHGQNSYQAPNHVYDAGHVQDKEMWQRSFGETVSPLFNNTCSALRSVYWRNRIYTPAQQFGSRNNVWGTCAKTCANLAALGQYKTVNLNAGAHSSLGAIADEPRLGGRSHYGNVLPWLGAAAPSDNAGMGAAAGISTPVTPATLAVGAAVVAVGVVCLALMVKHFTSSQNAEHAKQRRLEKIALLH